ncbi:ribosome biogenesis GTP-binding protein YsxC (macronuclear) [Tetrahymena thermophila SB210]|uniref:Ribosome biogenesis GTP-binding protein YsxC n=1 Tax=Tetrahymena thermophila (strain SB210) TaxID=312017 RepID=Q23TD6_TETTS|nr:ribosome biogenesis GTP-binding protein YsxC [Tetrahymena thermophila SB210]EAR99770.2 ribosome biogenesis GTP-binding protein YsxC [Tetrahymena thermophila SB210]|eukprot:XP_001020015.2 ribosome biogenesis GTP-binding protein YsxC [Tetrahymena thermophila SB210]
MSLFFKQIFRFSMALPETKIYYPVVNIHTQDLQYYDSWIGQQAQTKVRLLKQSETEITPQNMKDFFVDQIKTDMYSMYKPKEIIFIGRSNVGKSSLINSIFKRKVAKTSKKQGSTKKLYYYELVDNLGYIIDPPGYGFANVNVNAKKKWQGMIYDYIQISSRLARIYLLINAEHGLKKNDMSLLSQIQKQNVNIQIVLTKADKVPERALYDTMLSIGMQVKGFNNIHPLLHACSARNGFGIPELRHSIFDSLAHFEPRNIDDKEEVLLKFLESYRVRPKEFNEFYGKDALKPAKEQKQIDQKPKELPGAKSKGEKSGQTKRIKFKSTAKPKEIK